ncbi:MAG: hypothetical protein V3T05_10180, partial [Myxococcota bacterium]
MRSVHRRDRRRLPTVGLVLAASAAVTCTSTAELFAPIEFPQPPEELAADPTGAVVLSNEAEIEFRPPAAEGEPGPREPYVVITQKVRALVTGKVHPSLSNWRVGRNVVSNVTRVDVARARLARPDGTTVEVDGLAAGVGDRPIVLSLPEPQPGDLIDIVTQRTLTAVEALPPWIFAAPAPCVESRLKVIAPEGWLVSIRRGQGNTVNRGAQIQQSIESGGRNGWVMVERNVRAVPLEPRAPHPQRMAPWATAVLVSATLNGREVRYADSWATVAARVETMLAKTMEIDEASKQTMVRGLAKARLRSVHKALKPRGDVAGLFGRPARPFAEIEVGTASAIETVAVAAAAMEGMVGKAYLALVIPFEGAVLIDDQPGLYAMSSVVVAFPSDDEWTFADPACMTCPFGRVPMAVAGGRAVVLADSGPMVVEIPMKIGEPNRRRLQFDWTLSVEGEVTGTLIADLEGFVAQQVYRSITFAEDEDSRKRFVGALLFGPNSGIRIDELIDEGLLSP